SRMISVLAADARTQEPYQEIGILQAPACVGRFEAVHPIKVAPPDREIARARPAPRVRPQLAQRAKRQRQEGRQPVDLALPAQRQPVAQTQELDRARLSEDLIGELTRHQDAVAGHEPSRLGEPAVDRDEARPRDAIAVQKHAIRALAHEYTAIADFARAKSAILLPHMLERNVKGGGTPSDERTRLRARPIVGDNDLKVAVGLAREGAEHRVERVLTFVRGENDGDKLSHQDLLRWPVLLAACTCVANRAIKAKIAPAPASAAGFTAHPSAFGTAGADAPQRLAHTTERQPEKILADELKSPEQADAHRRRRRHVPGVLGRPPHPLVVPRHEIAMQSE